MGHDSKKAPVERLRRLVAPPKVPLNAGSKAEFASVEREIGLKLPRDYKAIITSYGDGCWQEFWYILNPFSGNKYLNLLLQISRAGQGGADALSAERYIRNVMAGLRNTEDYPHPIWPEPGGIFPWAVTDNGGRFFWLTGGSSDDWRTVYYSDRSPDYEEYDLSTGEIVWGAVSGELPIFAEAFVEEAEYGLPNSFRPLE